MCVYSAGLAEQVTCASRLRFTWRADCSVHQAGENAHRGSREVGVRRAAMPELLFGAIAAESRQPRYAISLLRGCMLAVCRAFLWMCSRSSFCSSLHATLGCQAQSLQAAKPVKRQYLQRIALMAGKE